jgi:D-glucosaminate-6-phosphate ammonia-lyase
MSGRNSFLKRLSGLSRRDLFRSSGLLGLAGFVPWRTAAAAPPAEAPVVGGLQLGANIYESIGVRPIINCRGTFTVLGGSIELPEVRAAKDIANQKYVQMDELMEAVGKRLAELTQAEWGMVSSGCAAAMSYATAACVAGGNPDLHQRIPNLAGFAKDQVVFPRTSRNNYDAAVRNVGVKVIEVATPEQLEASLGPRTAMVYVLAGAPAESGPLSLENVAKIARQRNVPVLVDAAAEVLTIPNVHLQRGATMVAYSGGKIIRGPQSAGILLGRKDLVKAAWIHSAPHHGFGRSAKVGREEIIGMLMAIESWVKRDQAAEMKEWVARAQHIADRVSKIDGVTASVRGAAPQGGGRSNRSAGVTISWDTNKIGITGQEVTNLIYSTEPRIATGGGAPGGGGRRGQGAANQTSISFNVSMIAAGDEKIVADRMYQVLSARHPVKPAEAPKTPATNLTGRWDVQIEFTASKTTHTLYLSQNGNRVEGTHQGDFLTREMSGSIDGDSVSLSSTMTGHGDSENFLGDLFFRFDGKVEGDKISGSLDMGEYLDAKWTAHRHVFGRQGAAPLEG